MPDRYDPEPFVQQYGEKHRPLIEDSLRWVAEKEAEWNTTLMLESYIADMIAREEKGEGIA